MITDKVIRFQKSNLERLKFFSRFLNTLTADDRHSLISKDKLMETIQMHLSQKKNIFSQFCSAFSESELNFEHFQKNITPIAYVFPSLPTTKDVLR